MADSKLTVPRSATVSPPPNCAICLGTCTNKCYSDSCMHEFCFKCLLEWSKIKAECPLCKQTFKSIIHNIKSNNEYEEHVVENIAVEDNRYLDNASLIYLPPATPPHQYHFRTTFTVDTHGEHAIQQMLLSHPLLTIGSFTPERYTHRRRRGDTSTTFRRSIYSQNLWVYAPPDVTGRYREVTPSFYRNNPAARTRLVPWLNRELNALLYENTQHVMYLVDVIMDHLLRHHICSTMFRALLTDYLGTKTDHFIHEFYNFMRSPFDMIGYDRHVIYSERPPTPSPYNIDVSDNDSDVIFVAPAASQPEPPRTEPVIIDLVDTDSDEPIIVSEEINGTASSQINEETTSNRKPILPLKLRIKNKHKSKRKKRRRSRLLTSSSSSTSNSSSTSTSSSDSDGNVYEICKPKKLHGKSTKSRKSKRRDLSNLQRELSSSDNEDEIPLSNFASKKKRSKHSEKRHKSHTATSKEPKIRFRARVSSSESPPRILCPKPEETYEPSSNPCNLLLDPPIFQSSSCRFADGFVKSERLVKSEVVEESPRSPSEGDTSDCDYNQPNVKSKINEVRPEDKPKAGPSTSRLRSILRKEESSNLWYSRPLHYDSDSSDG